MDTSELTDDEPLNADQAAPVPTAIEEPPIFVGYGRRRLWLLRNEQWLIYCLPFIVYMAVGFLEPVGPKKGIFPGSAPPTIDFNEPDISVRTKDALQHTGSPPLIDYQLYPYIYTAKIALTCAAMLFVWPGYRKFPWHVSWLSIAVGILGAVLWVGICRWQQALDTKWLKDMGLGFLTHLGERPGFNPLRLVNENPAWAWTFLAIRFFGLVVVVSIIEEFFLRGFLMRFVVKEDWWTVPFATLTPFSLAVAIGVPMLMHPQELAATAVWFSLVTWLMHKTKNIWDCVIAHAVTNLLMGLWVLYSGDWFLM